MRYKGKAETVAQEIIDAFQRVDIPEALAQVFIHRDDSDRPCARWSWSNRLLVALHGHHDARGFRQWQEVGRSVSKGQRAFHILAPWMVKAKDDDAERGIEKGDPRLIGFLSVPVFGYSQTEGDPLPGYEDEARFLDALPLVDVARAWEIHLTTFDGPNAPQLGYYQRRTDGTTGELLAQAIGLGVENLATWTHELIHAADYRRGSLTEGRGQKLDNEIVAQLGGAVLLECIGHTDDSDRGGCWRYIEHYAKEHERSPLSVCNELLDRTAECVALVLDTADQLAAEQVDQRASA